MKRIHVRRRFAPPLAVWLVCAGASAAPATQILDAADNAELAAEISAAGVNRIALMGDRIAKAVRAPDGYAVEHDAASGDLYLRSARQGANGGAVTLFIGTERGFTYRLALTPADRDSAQILIRNAEALPGAGETAAAPAAKSGPRVAALVRLVRAAARREAPPGYDVEAGGDPAPGQASLRLIETWRGPRFAAHVLETDAPGAADLARTIGEMPGMGRVAALWLDAPGPGGGRLVVAVTEAAGDPR